MRVEANRLRKRLAEYYAGAGNTKTLQITIPVGQYVPRFEVRKTAAMFRAEPIAVSKITFSERSDGCGHDGRLAAG